ncbi:MAG: dihydrolipoyl dehydrogenase [Porphyromonas sp.]|nr:dihydrolipoyl dehydrogenase [Bacteroidales bacterium]MDY3100205.1 dihydrolipoyl dehydrogenase [Porphyromonas sp.]
MTTFDLIVIGGGPGGYNAAALAADNGLKTALFEKNKVGGVCLNEGCIPTKALLHSANLFDTMREAKKYGITVDGDIVPDYGKIAARKSKIVRKLVLGVSQKLKASGVEVLSAEARISSKNSDGTFVVTAAGEEYVSKYVLLCTGSETAIPPIPGLAESGYWTSREALDAKELPESVVVIGGGVIGMEFVSVWTSLGVPVTVVEMMPKILGRMDSELSLLLQKEYEKRGVRFLLSTKVVGASPEGIEVETAEGERMEVKAAKILLSAGRRVVSRDLGLEELGVEMNRGAVLTNEYMETNVPGLYAAGDVTARSMLAHSAIRMGEVAVHHILGRTDDVMRYDAIPGVIYTHPEFASVGATEDDLKAGGTPYRLRKIQMAFAGRFVVENEGGNGVFKLLTDEKDRVIGAQMLGNPASEIIFYIGQVITQGLSIGDLRKQVYPHPTVGEIIHEIAYEPAL